MSKRRSSSDNNHNHNNKTKKARTTTTTTNEDSTMTDAKWGDWMGAWKVGDQIDQEAERIDRQKAAFGGDTISRLKDLNVLIVGCQGVGVETAKNLILSNIGGCLVYDHGVCRMADRGTNFYITDAHIAQGKTRAEASIDELKTLNPFCRVDVCTEESLTDAFLTQSNVLNTHRGFAAVVITTLLPKAELFRINETCRANHIAFLLAANHGVTCSLFSDFGPEHEIQDATGEPTQTLAVSNLEVLSEKPKLMEISGVKEGELVVIVTVAQAEHGLDDGDFVALEDMRGDLEKWNGKQLKVKRVAIQSPVRRMDCCQILYAIF
jgi:ubiquitin-activating enzyme E1